VSAGATARLSRLLTMVPWLLQRPGVSLSEAAHHFGISETQLVKDLELLFVCGRPGHLPDDLIEADWDSGGIYLGNADAIARPLRLGTDEAVALLAGLRMLAEVPGLHDRGAVTSALTKLSTAAGDAATAATSLSGDLTGGAQEQVLAVCREALRRGRRLRLTYLVLSRDETTQRDVSLMRITSEGSRWYLEGWCHLAEAVRLFRVDRVVEALILDLDGTPPAEAVPREGDDLYHPSTEDLLVTLDLLPEARWVAEYYQVERTEPGPDGALRVVLRATTPDWVPRLVLRSGGAIRVVTPAEIRDRVVTAAQAALDAYRPDA
jgi:proteasome accessory factor C